MRYLSQDHVGQNISWAEVVGALADGHRLPKAQIGDQFLERSADTLLSRAAWIDGLGFGVKSVSVVPDNAARDLPTVQGAMLLFDDRDGRLEAVIDSQLVTDWKTAADSALGASLLARPDSKSYLVVGAGVVAENLIHAYYELFPSLERIEIWNRTPQKAAKLADKLSRAGLPVHLAAADLKEAAAQADIISTATMAKQPILEGAWIQAGTHVDLIGAFKADMREADDALLRKARVFVDSFETTLEHIGELKIPIADGVLTADDVVGDLYDLVPRTEKRETDAEITVFKNGGGAHLDLMTAKHLLHAAT